jgi:hypothetical protein
MHIGMNMVKIKFLISRFGEIKCGTELKHRSLNLCFLFHVYSWLLLICPTFYFFPAFLSSFLRHFFSCTRCVLPPAERLNQQLSHRGLVIWRLWLLGGCGAHFIFVSHALERQTCGFYDTDRDVRSSCPVPLGRRDVCLKVLWERVPVRTLKLFVLC